MACILARPSAQALFDQYKNTFSVNVLGGAPVVPESNEWYVVALNYAMAEEFYAISEQQWKERDPREACCDNLFDLAAKDGVYPRPAAAAQGYVILRGVAGSALPAAVEVLAPNGRSYSSVTTMPAVMPPEGSLVLRVQDLEPGAAGNAFGLGMAQLSTAVPGLETDVEICGGTFCGGQNAEECEPFRTRYIARKQYQPRADQAWAVRKLMEWPCVTRVIPRGGNCCVCGGENAYSCAACGSSFDFYVMMDGSFACGVPPQAMVDEVQEWFFGSVPGHGMGQVEIGVCGNIIRPQPFDVNVYLDMVGCATVSQTAVIQAQVADFFTTVAPSTDLIARQIELIASNVIGPTVDVSARFEIVNPALVGIAGSPTECGDLSVNCDYVPCMAGLKLTGPGGNSLGASC